MLKHFAFFFSSLICLNLLDQYNDSITITNDWFSILIFLLILTAINWLVLPFFKVITFPFNIISFGLLNTVINLVGLWVAIAISGIISINANGLMFLFNLILISLTLSIAQTITSKIFN